MQKSHVFLVYPLSNELTYERINKSENQNTNRPYFFVTWGASSRGYTATRAWSLSHARTTHHSGTRCSGDQSCFGMLMSCWHGHQR